MGSPVVPRANPNVVSTAPLARVRVPTEVPEAAFRAPVGIDPSGVADEIAGMFEKHVRHADQVIMLDADNKLQALQSNLQLAALKLKGKDALGATQVATQGWQQGLADIEDGLKSEQQLEQFRLRAAARFTDLHDYTERHAADQWDQFEATTTDAAVQNRLEDAATNYRDPQAVARNAVEARAIIQDAGRRLGWDAQTTQRNVNEKLSQLHVGVINRFLAVGDDRAAQAYYEKSRSQIGGTHADEVERALQVSSTRGESQREGDRIMSSTVTLEQGLAAAAKITDPQLRDAVEERVRRSYADRASSANEQRFQAFSQAGVILERTKSVDSIPPATWNLLSTPERASLTAREDQLRHPRHSTDMDLWHSLMNMAGLNDSTRTQFLSEDLNAYRRAGRLDDQDFKQLSELQLSLRRQSSGAVAVEARRQAVEAQKRAAAAEALRAMGINVTPEPAVPGGPIRTTASTPSAALPFMAAPSPAAASQPPGGAPGAPVDTARRRVNVPQSWIDRAKRDANYRIYLEHMGVVIQ